MLKKGYKTGFFINTTTVLPPSGLAGESQGGLLEAMRSSFDRSAVPKAAEMASPSHNSAIPFSMTTAVGGCELCI